MLRDLLNGTIRAGLCNFEFKELPIASEQMEPQVGYNDSIVWRCEKEFLRVEFTRKVFFEPSCNFTIEGSYFVEHLVKEPGSLYSLSPDAIKKEIESDAEFYIQENQGFIARVCLLIAQVTASFGNTPLILPPNLSGDVVKND